MCSSKTKLSICSNLNDNRSWFTATKMFLKKFLLIISIRPCILRPTWEKLDAFAVDTNNIAGTRPHHNQIAHSWESEYDDQPYISSFHSSPDTWNSHSQDFFSLNDSLHEIEKQLSCYTDDELFGSVPSLGKISHSPSRFFETYPFSNS